MKAETLNIIIIFTLLTLLVSIGLAILLNYTSSMDNPIMDKLINNTTIETNNTTYDDKKNIDDILFNHSVGDWNLKDQMLLYEIYQEKDINKTQEMIKNAPQHVKEVCIEIFKYTYKF